MGRRIAARRRALGMTQRELAERLRVTDRAVSRWERDVGAPDLSLLAPLAYALEIGVDELLTGRSAGISERQSAFTAMMEVALETARKR